MCSSESASAFVSARINLYDYQALCKEYAGSSDSARTLLDVSTLSSVL